MYVFVVCVVKMYRFRVVYFFCVVGMGEFSVMLFGEVFEGLVLLVFDFEVCCL